MRASWRGLRIAPRLGSREVASQEQVWGTYHFTAEGVTTWHGFASRIVAVQAPITGRNPRVTPITTADYPLAARRPANCNWIAACLQKCLVSPDGTGPRVST